jgi:tripartite-type tricarboxylate transporter receptor subunit TctC
VLELHFTQKTAARPLIAPPDVPAERIATLRQAFAALAKDKEFLADADKAKLEFDFVPGEAIDKVVKLVASTPPDIAERYAKAFAPDSR